MIVFFGLCSRQFVSLPVPEFFQPLMQVNIGYPLIVLLIDLTLIYFGPTHSLLHIVVIVDHFHRYQTPLSAGSPVVAGGPFIDHNSNQIKITFCGILNSHQRLSCQQLST